MSYTLTAQEIAEFRTALHDQPIALESLDSLEECDGNLNAAMEIALFKAGYEFSRGDDDWIDWENILKDVKPIICNDDFQSTIVDGFWAMAFASLAAVYPHTILIAPILAYLKKKGIKHICT
ncbi:hypothetical protein [Candidatus Albibeggiatoa sp. nov. NOAA]|uniref:hypothetical protein n=1 Tax=Candidatus Albibeggiatoa sp. nov. NOAA TaxID=3162724 RepID=UPI0032F493BB|nr:hypothetical protein [Thiotrichaceae bacterium]